VSATNPYFSSGSRDTWIDRVRAADAEAEKQWRDLDLQDRAPLIHAAALRAIAAELRAARIARRPGAGQS
jgi:hypothetical protein